VGHALSVMRPYSLAQTRILADAYCRATGQTPRALSGQIFGTSNYKIISRILANNGCSAANLERASEWLTANWPEKAAWPISAPRNGAC
jgi:hypothetical protein